MVAGSHSQPSSPVLQVESTQSCRGDKNYSAQFDFYCSSAVSTADIDTLLHCPSVVSPLSCSCHTELCRPLNHNLVQFLKENKKVVTVREVEVRVVFGVTGYQVCELLTVTICVCIRTWVCVCGGEFVWVCGYVCVWVCVWV